MQLFMFFFSVQGMIDEIMVTIFMGMVTIFMGM